MLKLDFYLRFRMGWMVLRTVFGGNFRDKMTKDLIRRCTCKIGRMEQKSKCTKVHVEMINITGISNMSALIF